MQMKNNTQKAKVPLALRQLQNYNTPSWKVILISRKRNRMQSAATVVEAMKTVRRAISPKNCSAPLKIDGSMFPKINGMTNKAVSGKFRYEFAKQLGVHYKNVNLRDYLSNEQLAATNFLQVLLTSRTKENMSSEAIMNLHKFHCNRFTKSFGFIQGIDPKTTKKMTLKQARTNL